MNELIKVEVKNNQQVVSARDLYNGLEIAQRFSRWVDNNFEMFEEGIDFYKCTSSTVVNNGAVREIDDGQIVKHETEKDYDENPRAEIEVKEWTK